MAKGCPLTRIRAADAGGGGGWSTTVVTRGARWHSCGWYVDPNMAFSPDPAAQPIAPTSPMLEPTSPGDVVASAQSWPISISPSRHRPARARNRLSRPLPAARAAMQKGKHAAAGTHPSPPPSAQRGTTHTVASTSRHVPRAMQSCVVGSVVRSPLDPSVASGLEYRVYDQRTGFTWMSTPEHVYSLAAAASGHRTCFGRQFSLQSLPSKRHAYL